MDTAPPIVTVLSPVPGAAAPAGTIEVSGSVLDDSFVRVTVAGRDAAVKDHVFRAVGVPLGAGPEAALSVVARDAAGNTTTSALKLRVEARPPVVSITSPADGTRVSGSTVRVTGTVKGPSVASRGPATPAVAVDVNGQRAEVEGETFSADLPAAAGRLTLRATARSGAGHTATHSVTVEVDTAAPELTLDSPRPGTATRQRTVTVSGRVDDPTATVRVNDLPATVSGGSFSATVPVPDEGEQTIRVVAQDAAGNRRRLEVPVTVDRTPPSVRLSLADGASVDGRALSIVGTADDGGAISVSVNGESADRLARGFRAELDTLKPGRHVLEAVARDEAGNETRVQRTVTVVAPAGPVVVTPEGGPVRRESAGISTLAKAAEAIAPSLASGEGAVVGQVLSDLTGLPIAGATVSLLPGDETAVTDEAGRYSFVAPAGPVILAVEKDGMTAAERAVSIEAGAGVVAIDARLTPLASAVPIDEAGGALPAAVYPRRLRPADPGVSAPPAPATITLTVPPGAVAGPNTFRLTALSAQGLPGLLPLGYSPILTFALSGTAPPASAAAQVAGVSPLTVHLVAYDTGQHAWTLVASPLVPSEGTLDFTLAGLGTWALIAVDREPTAPVAATRRRAARRRSVCRHTRGRGEPEPGRSSFAARRRGDVARPPGGGLARAAPIGHRRPSRLDRDLPSRVRRGGRRRGAARGHPPLSRRCRRLRHAGGGSDRARGRGSHRALSAIRARRARRRADPPQRPGRPRGRPQRRR